MSLRILINMLGISIVKKKKFPKGYLRGLLQMFFKMHQKFGQPAKIGKFNARKQRFEQEYQAKKDGNRAPGHELNMLEISKVYN